MEESADLQEWELLHSSDTASASASASMRFEEIIRSEHFAIDPESPRSKLPQVEPVENSDFGSGCDKGGSFPVEHPELEAGSEGIGGIQVSEELVERGFEEFGAGSGKEASFLLNGSELEVGLEGIEPRVPMSGDEVGIEEIHYKGGSLPVDGSGKDADFGGTVGGELGKRGSEEFGGGSEKEASFLPDGSELGGTEGSDDLGSGAVVETSDSGSAPVGDGEKKRTVWWKLPVEILKLFVFRMRPIWSIPIAAAVIGIMMIGRRLYRMKHKNQRVPLKISFEDKKAAARLLVRAARHNEAVSRSVPVVRSPLLPASGVTPWPLVGLL